MRAKDIMTTNVITVGPDEPVADIARLLMERAISGVPVVDVDGSLLGIVSEGDLVHRVLGDEAAPRAWWLKLLGDPKDTPGEYVKSHGRTASDVMTAKPVTVGEDATVAEIAEVLETMRIKRVPVVEGGRLVGIVSRANILQALVGAKDTGLPAMAADDQKIRNSVLDALGEHSWGGTATMNVVVNKGAVQLWGSVESEDAKKAVVMAAEAVPGVTSVESTIAVVKRMPEYL